MEQSELSRERTLGMAGGLYIDGEWLEAENGERFPVHNPADGSMLAEVADGGAAEAGRAVDAAQRAFPDWAARLPKERAAILRRTSALMAERKEELGRLLTREQGKPLAEARGEILYAASFLDWYAEEGRRLYGEIVPPAKPGRRHLVLKQPVGVAAIITPWNFPAAMITRKVGPALAAGCTVVVKPAEQTPLSAVAMAELFEEAGLPKGVLNLVTTERPRTVGDAWLENPAVRKVSFTGSTEVGRYLMGKASQQVKRISLELGGHAPVLIFDDADLDAAVAGTIACKYRNMGQTCICANRIFVQERLADEFGERLSRAVSDMKVGNGLEEGVEVGPLIDRAGYDKVNTHVEDAISKGAAVLIGGNPWAGSAAGTGNGTSRRGDGESGYFFEPTVMSGITDGMLVMREETFGPVAPLITFQDEDEVIGRANETIYGLAAYVFTSDLGRAFRVGEALEYGIVGVNDPVPSTAEAPFGGYKQSGIGREGGREGIEEYVETKYLSLGI